jgi:hypothetical protein
LLLNAYDFIALSGYSVSLNRFLNHFCLKQDNIMARPFKSEKVIEERISEATLRAYHVGFDTNKFRLKPLVDIICRVIPEFSFGYHEGLSVPHIEMYEKFQEAAEIIYQTDKFQKRGEFGELILHLLLRDFHNTIPLISKIYFKDAHNVAVHGFDAVQVTDDGKEKKLWLGESKLYKSGKEGVADLVEDLKKHIDADFLRREFQLLYKKLPNQIKDIEYWRDLMDKHTTLDKIFTNIVIPMVCTYSSDLFKNHKDATADFFGDFKKESEELHSYFEKKKIKTSVDVILLLLPVSNRDELNQALYDRLKAFQS